MDSGWISKKFIERTVFIILMWMQLEDVPFYYQNQDMIPILFEMYLEQMSRHDTLSEFWMNKKGKDPHHK